MEIAFCIQDPTQSDTTYLYEAIICAANGAAAWKGVYAFASREAVNWLFDDPVINQFVTNGGEVDLVVGLDAITNRQTLQRLQELEQLYEHFKPKVFWNDVASLFHPKISDFTYPGGGRTLIVGSGNLTLGGLMKNIEGYTTISAERGEELDVSALDEFFHRHAEAIRQIDSDALERAERNYISRVNRGQEEERVIIASPPRSRRAARLVPAGRDGSAARIDRILIAQVPRAGGRWSQVHFNAASIREYFQMTDFNTHRVFLTQVGADGFRSDVEVRPCVYSQSNKNHKIEFGAAQGKEYPESPPVLVLREHQLRVFDYMLLFPGADGYAEVFELSEKLQQLGLGMPRVITNLDTLESVWDECPLLNSESTEDQFI